MSHCKASCVRPPWGRKLPDICLSASSLRSQAVMFVGPLRGPQGRAKHPTDIRSTCKGIAADVSLLRRPQGRAKHPAGTSSACKAIAAHVWHRTALGIAACTYAIAAHVWHRTALGIAAHVRPLRGRIADGTLSEDSRWSPSVMLVGPLRGPQGRRKRVYLSTSGNASGRRYMRLCIPEGGEYT
jgi:hypothetical protein